MRDQSSIALVAIGCLATVVGCGGPDDSSRDPDGGSDMPSRCPFDLPDTLELGGGPSAITVADLDADGCLDLVALVALPPSPDVRGPVALVVAWGDSAAPYDERSTSLLPGDAGTTAAGDPTARDSSSRVLSVIDFDGDGNADVVTAGGIALGDGARSFGWQGFPDEEQQLLQPVVAVDFDGTGQRVVRGTRAGQVELCTAAGSCEALPGQPEACSPDVGCAIQDVAVGDFDHDGRPDVIGGGWPLEPPFANVSRLWLSSENHDAAREVAIEFVDYVIGDLDGDGFLDVVAPIAEFISDFPSHTQVWLSDPAAPDSFVRRQEILNAENHNDNAALADVNDDGCLDYLTTGVDRGAVFIRLGNPRPEGGCTGLLGDHDPALSVDSGGWSQVPVGGGIGIQQLDVNGDGTADWVLRELAGDLRFITPPTL